MSAVSTAHPGSPSTPQEGAGEVQGDSREAEVVAGREEGDGEARGDTREGCERDAGKEQQDTRDLRVAWGGSGVSVPVVTPALVYTKGGDVVDVDQRVVKAVDRFKAPDGFVRKGSREQSFMYSVGVYVEAMGSVNHKYFCLADSKCRRKTKVVPCKNGDRSNVNTHLKNTHGLQGTGGLVKAKNRQINIKTDLETNHQPQGTGGIVKAKKKRSNIKTHLKTNRGLEGTAGLVNAEDGRSNGNTHHETHYGLEGTGGLVEVENKEAVACRCVVVVLVNRNFAMNLSYSKKATAVTSVAAVQLGAIY